LLSMPLQFKSRSGLQHAAAIRCDELNTYTCSQLEELKNIATKTCTN